MIMGKSLIGLVFAFNLGGQPVHAARRHVAVPPGVTFYKTVTDGRGALVVSSGGCTVVVYSGATPATPPDTTTTGSCNVQQIARRLAK